MQSFGLALTYIGTELVVYHGRLKTLYLFLACLSLGLTMTVVTQTKLKRQTAATN